MSDNNFRKGPHASKNKPTAADVEVLDAAVSSADERKTVILDEDLDGVEFEDKVWLYWKRNKNFIIFSIAAAFAVVLGVQGFKIYRASARDTLAAAYAEASTPEQLAKFASANAGTKLAGIAILQKADSLYKDGKFDEAAKEYAKAAADLSGTILEGRALIGQAASAGGSDAFKKVYENAKIDAAYRMQAGYLMGLSLQQAGKLDDAKSVFRKVAESSDGAYFSRLAEEALSRIN